MTANILVVEDEAVIARDIRGTLQALGYLVGPPVASGPKALEAIATRAPDLVLMDIRIQGDMDGIETAAQIRELRGPPVVYLTSHSDEATISRAKATGAYGYVLKPFSERELRIAIEVALKKHELELHALENERRRSDDGRRILDHELGALTYSLAHDLRTPLRAMSAFSELLLDGYRDQLDSNALECVIEIQAGANRMANVIDAMLAIARVSRAEVNPVSTDLSALACEVASELVARDGSRTVELAIVEGLRAPLDPSLARLLLEALLTNAWKFTARTARPRVELGTLRDGDEVVFFVRDNGAGFDMGHADKLFVPFQSLHASDDFPGVRIGLAITRIVVARHGGRVWAEGAVDAGATFFVALPSAETERRSR